MSLFNELKRRNVFRVGIAYIVMAWLVMQVADVILNNIEAPGWIFQVIMLLLGIGFLFAMFFAWAFELTPEGLKRESEVDRTQSIAPQTGKKLDRLITGVLVLALAYFILDKFVLSAGREEAAVEAALEQVGATTATQTAATEATSSEPDKSIAVLPFVNMSSDAEQEYFSDGLSEELLNQLTSIPDLKVASRSSSFQFKGEKIDITEVAKKLKVAHILEGSVRKAGNQVRITAQLIRADNGYHLWSDTYDRSLDNIFAIQDEISQAVVQALKIKLMGEAPRAKVVNSEAYALMLKGRFLHTKWGQENFENAVVAYKQALEIEPDYAEAWAALSVTYLSQGQNGYLPSDEGLMLAKSAVKRALEINPELASAWARLALIQSMFEWDWTGAQESVDKAVALDPDESVVLGAAGNLASTLGQMQKALGIFKSMLELDPLDLISMYNFADTYHRLGDLESGEAAYRRLLELNPEDWGTHTQLAIILLRTGRTDEAWEELSQEVDPKQQEYGRILALYKMGRTPEAEERLNAFIAENQSWAAFLIAGIFAWHGDKDTAFDWLDTAYQQRDGLMASVKNDPLLLDLHSDPRWAVLLDKMGLPH